MKRFEADFTTAKERVSCDKVRSLISLVFGSRALHFDAFLEMAPSSAKITALAQQTGKPDIHNVIFDLDGTLVPPYAPIAQDTVDKLDGFRDDNRNVAIYTNSPHSDRLNILRQNGIAIAETGVGKPTLEGYKILCDREGMEPECTAMVGNSPITDMPLVEDGAGPFFPLNVLVESIPPQRELFKSWLRYYRAKTFHTICVAAARVVRIRNPNMIRGVSF